MSTICYRSVFAGWGLGARLLGLLEKPCVSRLRELRVALVKNRYFFDLYQISNHSDRKSLVASSLKRSGPIGLFTEFDADFYIVDTYPDSDGQLYRERLHQISDSEFDDYMNLAQRLKEISIGSDEVDWSMYDLVIALDNAVPACVTEKHPEVVWATMLESHRMPSYPKYLKNLPRGYDVFLSQHFGPNPRKLKYRDHVVDWPYGFTKSGAVENLLGRGAVSDGVTLESHGRHLQEYFVSSLKMPVRVQGGHASQGTTIEILEMLLESRYFCAVNPRRPLWGNALVEAASAGCLVIADPNLHWNPYVVLPELRVSSAKQAVGIICKLEECPERQEDLLTRQNQLLDWYAFHRPLSQLESVVSQLGRPTRLKRKLSKRE